MNCITEKLSEELYNLYDGIKPKKNKRVEKSGTLCWRCQNAVPTADGKRGCEWSLFGKPVPGWDAKNHKIPCGYGNQHRIINSYNVISCPRFMED